MRVMTIGLTAVVAVTVALLLLPAFTPRAALASGVVGTGSAASCTDAAFNAALAGGGLVTFNCGSAAVTIDISTGTGTKTISADTTIDGGSLIAISGGNSVGVFSASTGVNFTVQNLIIANGYGAGSGGGISNNGTLTVTNSTFSGNGAPYGSGGGISSYGALTVTNSTFSGNSAGGYGGGIQNDGTLTVTNSTFSGNSTGGDGGGIANVSGTLTVTDSTFSGNSTTGDFGGGISNEYDGTLTVTNSTFSGNSASAGGGGIWRSGTGPVTVTNSTFSGNSASAGGGIYNNNYYGTTTTVTNTVVANSTSGGNCFGGVTDGGHNIDDGTTCGFTGSGCAITSGSSFCNTNPQLAAGLANNGGPTQTIALLSSSPAINAGDESVCSTTTGTAPVNNLDQRGFVRPGTGATNCSIGAFEANSAPVSCGNNLNLNQGLVAYYPFDGNANDASGFGRDGTVVGATLAADRFGNPNGSYHFSGGDYIWAAADGLPTGERTTALWFRTDNLSTQVMLGYGGGSCGTSWFMGIGSEFFTSSHCNVNSIVYPQNAPVGVWTHYAVTTDPGGTRLYVNGVLEAENTTFVNNTNVTGTDLGIGVASSPGGVVPYTDVNIGYFVGEIDDVRIYNRALSAAEMFALGGPGCGTGMFTGITNAPIGGAGTVDAGGTVGYTITVTTAACTSNPVNGVQVHDTLPTDINGNPETTLVSSDCQSTAPGATSPACVGGAGALDATGKVLTFTFPGSSCGGTLTMHVYLKINSNLDDGTLVTNCTSAEGGAGDVVASCDPVTVASSKLAVYPVAVCGDNTLLCDTQANADACWTGGRACIDPDSTAPTFATCRGGGADGTACDTQAHADTCYGGGGVCGGVDTSAGHKTLQNAAGANIANNQTTTPSDGTLKYSFLVENLGSLDATGLIVQDALPAGESLVPGSAAPAGFPDDCSVCGSLSSGVLSWQYSVLHPKEVRPFEYKVTTGSLPAGAILFNVATAFDSTGHTALGTHTATENSPCLTLTKIVDDCTHSTSCGGSSKCAGVPGTAPTTPPTDNPLAAPGPTDTIEYSLTLTALNNPGCNTANNLIITDPLAAGVTFVSCTPDAGSTTCFFDGSQVTFVVPSLLIGTAVTETVKLQVNAGTANGTVLNNVATAVAANGGGVATASRSVTVQSPQLQLVKAASPNPVEPGGTVNYTVLLSNAGGNCASQVLLTDVLPANGEILDGTFTGSGNSSYCPDDTYLAGNVVFDAADSKFMIQPGTGTLDLPAGAACQIQYQVLVPEGTQVGTDLVNTATAVDRNLVTSATSTLTTPVNTRLLGLSKTITGCTASNGTACSVTNPPAGSTLQYTLEVTSGPYMATGVIVTDGLPSPAVGSFVSTTCPSSSLVGGVLTCNLGNVAPNGSASFNINFKLNSTNPSGTQVTNKASATDDAMDQLGVSNTVTDAVSVAVGDGPADAPTPSLQVAVSAKGLADGTVHPGGRLTYKIGVQNTGDADAHNVTVTETFPASLRMAGVSGGCKVNRPANSVTCTLGTLSAGQSSKVEAITTVVRSSGVNAAQAGQVIASAVSASCEEGSTASGTASTTVVAAVTRR